MKLFPNTICIILVVGLLSGCSTTTMNRIMSSWEGEQIGNVIAQWGYPDSVTPMMDNKLYRWSTRTTAYTPQYSTTTGQFSGNTLYANTVTTGGNAISGSCERILEVGPMRQVISWQWKGNNCPFAEWFQYATWRNKAAAPEQ